MKKVPIIKIKDDPEFSKTHIEVSVRFDWDFEAPGKNRDVTVNLMLERGPHSIEELRECAIASAREIMKEALNPASS